MVWLPALNSQSPSALEKNGAEGAGLISDPRVRFYVDPKEVLGTAYGKLMHIPDGSPAWDIYFAFGPDAQWRNKPPKPDFWMHQLWGVNPKLLLNGPVFLDHVKRLLDLHTTSTGSGRTENGQRPSSPELPPTQLAGSFFWRARTECETLR